jgi:Secretion system C-terminal sorting domain
MRSLILSLICLMLQSTLLFAQPPNTQWRMSYGSNNTHYELTQALETDDDGILIVGDVYIGENDLREILVIKTDSDGEAEWERTYEFLGANLSSSSLRKTDDGGYIICGVKGSNLNDNNLFLFKLYSDGEVEWEETILDANLEYGCCIQQTEDGGYVISGHSGNPSSGRTEAALLKTDSYGNLEYSYAIEEHTQTKGEFVLETSDGCFVVIGPHYNGIFLIKMDSDGNVIWDRDFLGSGFEQAACIQETDDGGYIIAGMFVHNNGNKDMGLIKTNSVGSIVWTQSFGSFGDDYGSDVKQTDDGGYIITGTKFSSDQGDPDIWVIKTDSNGEIVWESLFGGTNGAHGESIIQASDGGYLVGSSLTNGNYWYYHLIRFDTESTTVELDSPTPSEYVLNDIYPNPFNSMTTISVGLPETSDLKLMVYNINGQRVSTVADRSCSAGTHSFTFNADDLGSGVYFVQAIVEGKLNQIQKVVLIR